MISINLISDRSSVQRSFLQWWKWSPSILSNMVASSHLWLLSACSVASVTKELNRYLNRNLSGHIWLVATVLDSRPLEPKIVMILRFVMTPGGWESAFWIFKGKMMLNGDFTQILGKSVIRVLCVAVVLRTRLESSCLRWVLAPPHASFVTFGKSLHLFESQCPHLEGGGKKIIFSRVTLRIW